MKAVVTCLVLFAFVALAQSASIVEEADHPLLVSELKGEDIHPVTPEEMAALGYADAARVRICIASQCNNICRALGYRIGLCSTNAYCVCFR